MSQQIKIFTDGACSGNPGPGGWAAIVSCDRDQTFEIGGSENSTTNNRMELTAALKALEEIQKFSDVSTVTIYTDSKYLIDGITKWIHGWKRTGWTSSQKKEDVKNKDLWEAIDRTVSELKAKATISWKHVDGHAGVPGNERCDEIAVTFSKGIVPELFRGRTLDYPVSLDVGPKSPKIKPYYLSLVGGQLARDETWPACQSRVKGAKGAKYKKVSSVREEQEILKLWGHNPKS